MQKTLYLYRLAGRLRQNHYKYNGVLYVGHSIRIGWDEPITFRIRFLLLYLVRLLLVLVRLLHVSVRLLLALVITLLHLVSENYSFP